MSETQWYEGTADAVYQNIDILQDYGIDHVVVLAGDHVYKMDYEIMLEQHVAQRADVTVGCLEVPRMEAMAFGVMHVDEQDRIVSFLEKPADPPGIPGSPDMALASMGIYVFDAKFLYDQLRRDAADPNSAHDFGNDIIPYLVKHGKAVAHRFAKSCVKSKAESEDYWRDAGTVDAYFDANMDLTRIIPALDLYDAQLADLDLCRDHAAGEVRPRRGGPARHGGELAGLGRLHHLRRLLAQHPAVHRRPCPFLRPPGRLPWSCPRSRSAAMRRLSRVVIDRGVQIPPGLVVGEDPELDAQRFRRTEHGDLPGHPADAGPAGGLTPPVTRSSGIPAGHPARPGLQPAPRCHRPALHGRRWSCP